MPTKDEKNTPAPTPIEKVKVVYNGDVTWAGNIGAEEFIMVKGEEYELPVTEFVTSLINQQLLLKSSNK